MSYFFGFPDQKFLNANCDNSVLVGDCVYIISFMDSVYTVGRADMRHVSKLPTVGIVVTKESSTKCVVQLSGLIEGIYSGLLIGKSVFVGLDGQITQSSLRDADNDIFLQIMGSGISPNSILLSVQFNLTKILS